MKHDTRENDKSAMMWLAIMCLLGSLVGWVIQGVMMDRYIIWALPLFLLGAVVVTINGDNIIESVVVLLMLGAIFFGMSRVDAIVSKIGVGTIIGAYMTLIVAKIGFAAAKKGFFGNKKFS